MQSPWPTSSTRFAGVIGWPVNHSLSPSMHNAAFRALDLDWAYLAFPIHPDRVADAVRGLFAAGCSGLNVTIPHKQAVIDCCSSVSPAVEAIGAANTHERLGQVTLWVRLIGRPNGVVAVKGAHLQIMDMDMFPLRDGRGRKANDLGIASNGFPHCKRAAGDLVSCRYRLLTNDIGAVAGRTAE